MMKKNDVNASEPFYYVAVVLRGSEKQYLDLLKYINTRNRAQVIYQCKSLTYLHVSRDDGVRIRPAEAELLAESKRVRGEL